MDVEIAVPRTPVAVEPGVETRVEVEVRNLTPDPLALRLGLARGRAAAWARIEPSSMDLAPGGVGNAELVLRPPADTPHVATLLPFTVRADDHQHGVPLGSATGLVSLAPPDPLVATLTVAPGAGEYVLALHNRARADLMVTLEPLLHPAGGGATVDPPVLEILAERGATARVRARPRRPLLGRPRPYALRVSCRDAGAEPGTAPLARADASGTAPPWVSRGGLAALAAVVVLAGAAAGVAATGWRPAGLGGAGGPAAGGGGSSSAVPPPAVTVRRPYALVESFPQVGAGSRAGADQALARLTGAGVSVRLVDSLDSPDIADGQGGFWVLVRDGFASPDEARAFCDQHRVVAPRCEVVQ
jgi:hypothetical protein